MRLYRYELSCDGDYQEVGFLVGLQDIGLSNEVEERLLAPFNSKLAIPDSAEIRNAVFFFTEYGRHILKDEIQAVCDAYNDSIFDVDFATLRLPESHYDKIIYADLYQICIPQKTYEELTINGCKQVCHLVES